MRAYVCHLIPLVLTMLFIGDYVIAASIRTFRTLTPRQHVLAIIGILVKVSLRCVRPRHQKELLCAFLSACALSVIC